MIKLIKSFDFPVVGKSSLSFLLFVGNVKSLFLSTLASVCSGAFNSAESWGGVFLASLNAGISFLLAVVSYLKLDAQSEAHKISAHQYDKLQSICEFASGSLLLFTDMTGFDKKGTAKEREKQQLIEVGANIKKRLDEIETKINQIVGVVTNGLFAARPADILLLGTDNGVKTIKKGA